MIVLDTAARIRCSQMGCKATMAAELCLLTTGGFAFRPADPDGFAKWQVGAGGNGVFMCFCALHKQPEQRVVQVGPSGVRPNPKAFGREH